MTCQTERHVLKMTEQYLGCLAGTNCLEKDRHTQVLSVVPFSWLFSVYPNVINIQYLWKFAPCNLLWYSLNILFLFVFTPQDGNILHKDNLTVKDISQHTFRTTLKDKKLASCWKERLTLNSCLQLVNTRLRARTIRSCLMVLNIKSIDQGEQQSKHKLPFKFSQKKRR